MASKGSDSKGVESLDVDGKEPAEGFRYQRAVVVVEDDDLVRSLLASYLENAGFLVSSAGNATDARRVINSVDPDAVVLDIDLGRGPTGLDIADLLAAQRSDVVVVFLTQFSDPRFANRDMKSAHPHAAYLNKQMLKDPTVLLEALEAVLHERDISSFRHDRRVDRPFAQLSNTQVQVLRLISEGKTNAQIAEIRGRSLAATESAVTRTLKALGLDDASEQNVRVAAARKFLTNQPNA
jgi:DNA-binding NarL/FixJ family response regulator